MLVTITRWMATTPLVRAIRASLALKFILFATAVILAIFSLSGVFTYVQTRDAEIERLRTKGYTLAAFVASVSPDRLFSHDYEALHNFVKQLNAFPDVQYAIIYDNHDLPLTSYLDKKKPHVKLALLEAPGIGIHRLSGIIDQQKDVEVFTAPILFSDKILGKVHIAMTRFYANQIIQNSLLQGLAASLLAAMALGIGAFFIFRRQVTQPAQQLILGARRIAAGDLREYVPFHSSDEIGQLTVAFNDMTDTLIQSDQARTNALNALRDLNRTLEKRIESRTRDIETARKELERLALYDALTGLANRTLMHDRLQQLIKTSSRTNTSFAVCLMDLDRFKEVNDTFGHATGDVFLQRVAKRLQSSLRGSDTICRLGGDEFAILLPNTDAGGVVQVAEKILATLEQPEEIDGVTFVAPASIGIAIYPEQGEDGNLLLKHADIAMYEAKHDKSGFCIFHKEIDTHSPRRLELMTDLRAAFERNQMELHFQPIVDTQTREIRSLEVLARWPHPTKGNISPDQFIPMIEHTAMFRPFAQWVIDTSLRQYTEWNEQGIAIPLSVNLSMRNLQDRSFPPALGALLKKWSVAPHALWLEITESAMMNNPAHAMETLIYIKNLGADIAIDDFGVGYSSLSYLSRLPVTKIKIDRGFVQGMLKDVRNTIIVRSTIDLAHNLGLQVVAEGVENEDIFNRISALGCDLAQGEYFGLAMNVKNITKLLQKQSGNG